MSNLYAVGPLSLSKLTTEEIGLLSKLGTRLEEFIKQNKKPGRPIWKRGEPWAQIDEQRQGRILVIDGKRGAGKTSLLLTLIQELQGKGTDADGQEEAKELVGRDAGHAKTSLPLKEDLAFKLKEDLASLSSEKVRVFQPLDFDPLPPSMPLHGWLLQPWSVLVNAIEPRHGSDSFYEPDGKDLREQYRGLFERAVTGWSDIDLGSKSLLESSLDQFEQATNWYGLRGDWFLFVEAVIATLESRMDKGKAFPVGSLLVIPIDDVDLQCERLPDLFHALRLFSHPQVVYLLTANLEHAEQILQADYLGRHRKVSRTEHAHELAMGGPQILSELPLVVRDLAQAQMEKTFPFHDRCIVEDLTLKTVLTVKLDGKSVKEWLNIDRDSLGSKLEEFVSNSDIPGELCSFRRLAQSDTHGGGVLRTLMLGVPRRVPPLDLLNLNERGQLAVSTEATWTSSDFLGGRIFQGGKVRARFEAASGDFKFRSPANLYLTILLRDAGIVSAPNIRVSFEEVFAWTTWDRPVGSFRYVWPFLAYPRLDQFHLSLYEWSVKMKGVSDSLLESGDLLRWWITLQLFWFSGERCFPETAIELKDLAEKCGDALDRAKELATAEKGQGDQKRSDELLENILVHWITMELRCMCYPEYRLHGEVRESLNSGIVKAEKVHRNMLTNRHALKSRANIRSYRVQLAETAFQLAAKGKSFDEGISKNAAKFLLEELDPEFKAKE